MEMEGKREAKLRGRRGQDVEKQNKEETGSGAETSVGRCRKVELSLNVKTIKQEIISNSRKLLKLLGVGD